MKKYLIVTEKTGTGYSAYSPDLEGCVATGATRQEVESQMQETISFHLLARVDPENQPASFGKVPQARLKDDVAQVHRAIVAVEASDCAIVVGRRIYCNDDGAKAARRWVDRGARRTASSAGWCRERRR